MERISVAFEEVQGLDAELAAFLAEHWSVSDHGIQVRYHDHTMLEMAYAINPMVVVQRKDRYDVLGSGRALWLAQQLYQPEDSITVLRIAGSRLRKAQKLQILAADLLIHHALTRTRPHLPHKLFSLHQAIAEAGFVAIADPKPTDGGHKAANAKVFAIATGYSEDAVLPRHLRHVAGDDPDAEPGP